MRVVIAINHHIQAIERSEEMTASVKEIIRCIKSLCEDAEITLAIDAKRNEAYIIDLRHQLSETLPAQGIRIWDTPFSGQLGPQQQACNDLIEASFFANLQPDAIVVFDQDVAQRLKQYSVLPEQRIVSFADQEAIDDSVLEKLAEAAGCGEYFCEQPRRKNGPQPGKTLAYVSPLPPEKSGISTYSMELISVLKDFYCIDLIVSQPEVSESVIDLGFNVRNVAWFKEHFRQFDRVVYHVGNAHFHQHMFALMQQVPGVVVLHDFYLNDVQRYREFIAGEVNAWREAVYRSHGYGALETLLKVDSEDSVMSAYPLNYSLIQDARGVIVHSEYSKLLGKKWYSEAASRQWRVIPHLRDASRRKDRKAARKALRFGEEDFIVCCFGLLGAAKLNHRLLEAWIASELHQSDRCKLIFVGKNAEGEYGEKIKQFIQDHDLSRTVEITGWADDDTYTSYLEAADVAVQLRGFSRGETSGAVLDCMNYGLATIINANGAMAELPANAVCRLDDTFEQKDLAHALNQLWQNRETLRRFSNNAAKYVQEQLHPEHCAQLYLKAIESFYRHDKVELKQLADDIAALAFDLPEKEMIEIAGKIAVNQPKPHYVKTLFVDVSATARNDLKTGIQRVVRAVVSQLLHAPPEGWRVEPVYFVDHNGRQYYKYASQWTLQSLGLKQPWLEDEKVDFRSGDLLLVADFTGDFAIMASKSGCFQKIKASGTALYFVIYDLLPVLLPDFFPPNSFGFKLWLESVCREADGIAAISQTVATDFMYWMDKNGPERSDSLRVGSFHLGADVESSIPTLGLTDDADKVLGALSERPSFLLVGTIEPRKGHLQVIEAFELLWQQGKRFNLVIVGNEGWAHLPDDQRRTIPVIADKLRNHPQLGKQLFWLEGISDEYLGKVYEQAVCLIAASEGEGFGLPLVEAAQKKMPIIARDIPVFKEVAQDYAYYFTDSLDASVLCDAIVEWYDLFLQNLHPESSGMPWLTWEESTQQLLKLIVPQ